MNKLNVTIDKKPELILEADDEKGIIEILANDEFISNDDFKSKMKDFYNILDEISQTHEPIIITGKRNNTVLLSEKYWKQIEETLYLNNIEKMASSIQKAKETKNSDFSETIEW
ncbi:MAG: type II toxin-antitoxin system Phd/YefM family antitoxin [Poseidonibacter sp.]|uniref:type II toxin-antitoxin system Phd/YefM family antitoxin n=1 Tax=Poseidonibacter sp. TaxID=2321188 RepID=UPI00359D0A40